MGDRLVGQPARRYRHDRYRRDRYRRDGYRQGGAGSVIRLSLDAAIGSAAPPAARADTGDATAFLSTAVPTRRDGRLAAAFIIVSILVFVAAAPFAALP